MTDKILEEHLGLDRNQSRRALKPLVVAGLIAIERKGNPNHRHVKVDLEQVRSLLGKVKEPSESTDDRAEPLASDVPRAKAALNLLEPTVMEKTVIAYVRETEWRGDFEKDIEQVVARSSRNVQRFACWIEELLSADHPVDDELRDFIEDDVLPRIKDTRPFLKTWFDNVKQINDWDKTLPSFFNFVFTPRHQFFVEMASGWSCLYCDSTEAWTNLKAIIDTGYKP